MADKLQEELAQKNAKFAEFRMISKGLAQQRKQQLENAKLSARKRKTKEHHPPHAPTELDMLLPEDSTLPKVSTEIAIRHEGNDTFKLRPGTPKQSRPGTPQPKTKTTEETPPNENQFEMDVLKGRDLTSFKQKNKTY